MKQKNEELLEELPEQNDVKKWNKLQKKKRKNNRKNIMNNSLKFKKYLLQRKIKRILAIFLKIMRFSQEKYEHISL
ncbi:hypothetical protein FKB33_11340 [Enterococcus faecium]|nr:hypothetical protein [Enterococcus faecium]